MKYRVGDKVRIVNERTSFMNSEGLADHWLGKTMTIIAFTNKGLYKMKEDKDENAGCGWVWGDREIVCHVREEQGGPVEIIAIYRNGSETVAVRRHGHDTVKTAIARCSPADEYKFEIGAQLAYNRLMYGTDYHPAEVALKKDEPKLYNGRVVCIDNGGNRDNYTVGKIYQFNDGQLMTDSGEMTPNNGWLPYSFSDWVGFSGSKWIEIVE